MPRCFGIIPLLLVVILLSGCSLSLAGDITPPPGSELTAPLASTQSVPAGVLYPIVPPGLANGKKLYNQECAQCHGEKGLGDGPQAAQLSVPVASLGLSDFARQYSPAEWYSVVTQGNMEKFMPAFSNLTDRQRWDVVAYAMSLSISAQSLSQGKTLYQKNCAGCHGISGTGDGPDASTLATQPTDFTDQSFMAQNSSARLYQAVSAGIAPDMPAYTGTLDENERWALVSYLRSLTFTAEPPSAKVSPTTVASLTSQPSPSSSPGSNNYPIPAVSQTLVLTPTSEATPAAPITGTVTVQLFNGSGGDAPSDSPVTLYGFDNMQNTYSETLTTGENGVYTFTNVIMPEGRVFLAGTEYASGTYPSGIATVDPTTPNLNLQITVFESTTDVSLLTTDKLHIFFDFSDPQNAQVIEVFIITNPTKTAVVSSTPDGTVITFPLPQGYANLQFQDGELGTRYVEVPQGFADKMTVHPGVDQYQVVIAFQMPYNRKLDFVQPMFLPTSSVLVLVPDNGIKVSSAMLEDGGTTDYQGTTYRIYNGSSLIAGSSLNFTLSGNLRQNTASFFTTGTMQNLAIGLGVFGVALVVAGLWLFRRNRQKLASQRVYAGMDISTPLTGDNGYPEDEDTLMDAIIALDDQYHAGNLPQEAYLERRAILKDKLRRLDGG